MVRVSLVLASMMVALAPCNGNRDKNKTQRVDTPGAVQGPVVDQVDMDKLLKDSGADQDDSGADLAMKILLGNSWAETTSEIRIIDATGSEVKFGDDKYRHVHDLERVAAGASGRDLYLVISNTGTLQDIREKFEFDVPDEDGYLAKDQENARNHKGKHLRLAYKFVLNAHSSVPSNKITFSSHSSVFQATWMVKVNFKLYSGVRQLLRSSKAAQRLVDRAIAQQNFEPVGFIAHMGFIVAHPEYLPSDAKATQIPAWTDWVSKFEHLTDNEWDEMVEAVGEGYAQLKNKPDGIDRELFTRDEGFMEKYSVDPFGTH